MPTLAVEPIYLEATPASEIASQATSNAQWMVGGWGVLFTGLFVVLACLFAARFLLRRSRTTDLDAAFSRLARRTWLPRSTRRSILALSEASGVPAAAMLLSRGAFTAAIANADTQDAKPARAAAPRIMQACFAECAPAQTDHWWTGIARRTKRPRA